MRHPKSTEMAESLTVLHTFDDGSQIIGMGKVITDGEGTYAGRVVLRTLPNNDYHPFVVHEAYYIDDVVPNKWAFHSGDYCRDIVEAMTYFEKRI